MLGRMRDILRVLRKVVEAEDEEMKGKIEKELGLGWTVELILAEKLRGLKEGTTILKILFSNSFLIDGRVHDNRYLKIMREDCDYMLKKVKKGMKSEIKYDVGHTRICVEYPSDNIVKDKLEKIYEKMLRRKYKPLIKYLKGFYRKDFFGIEAKTSHLYLYYSLVREDREEANANLFDVIDRMEDIERKMEEYCIFEKLREIEEEFKCKVREICEIF